MNACSWGGPVDASLQAEAARKKQEAEWEKKELARLKREKKKEKREKEQKEAKERAFLKEQEAYKAEYHRYGNRFVDQPGLDSPPPHSPLCEARLGSKFFSVSLRRCWGRRSLFVCAICGPPTQTLSPLLAW